MTALHGYLMLVLHAHLPYVRHPEHDEFLEEDWLFEAMLETYIPLLQVYDRLVRDGIAFNITMTLTPPLCEMLSDSLLVSRFDRHLTKLERLTHKELRRTRHTPLEACAQFYAQWVRAARATFEQWQRNLVAGFRHFQDTGQLEIITCSGTHCLLPLCATPAAARAHVRMAVRNYQKHFGRPPRGIWLAECAYTEGVEEYLADSGIRYFFLDTHGILFGEPRPRFGNFAPVFCPNGVAAFARDIESSKQVWSSEVGYPGDVDYREFYRDLGFDADEDYIRPFLHADGRRRNLGIKYHRITGKVALHAKELYDPAVARERAAEHAGNFLFNRQHQTKHLHDVLGRPPVIVAPYDAELYGHWWFEGPWFIEFLLRKIACDQRDIATITPGAYLELFPANQVVQPCASTWGDKGYYEVWLNGGNDWIYRHLHAAEEFLLDLIRRFKDRTALYDRALNQAARELMLAQSSDWAFIMTTGTTVPYAEKRTRDHIHNFYGLYLQLMEDRLETAWLAHLEQHNSIFPEMDYHIYLDR
jgi:1,4-alpha-glucan branching enzyme